MSEEIKLKPCPFCGGMAEIYTGRTYPVMSKSRCKTEAEARAYLEECRRNGVVSDFFFSTRTQNIYSSKVGYIGEKSYYAINVLMQAYIPRCLDKKCLGRTQIMFKTEGEAIEAWNRRHPDARS